SQQLHALLDVAKQEAPLPIYEYLPIDIGQLMAECAETMQSQFQRKGVTLNITVDEPIQVIGDKGLLERLILNLLENALRHSPSDATVSCDVKRGDNTSQVRFTFSNQIELNAQAGALGIGTKIVRSILMLHHSHLETDATSHQYTQRFTLPAA
ncbi:sensor histidine kinase, partial [Vibrio sp. 812(2023)]|uniref:sensor histidine kinase n=1 Tax=Vibrio sp. 812(2023) TaxID=3074711 RepID=UPI002965BC55|nr:sensor histidine kinase [Vibrio sp. 812(2023)]